jgi:ubiquinone/menaquinone biosynthesis C-methylase UbiE
VAGDLVRLKPKVARRIGVDIDPVVIDNPGLHEAHILTDHNDYRIPLPDGSVDAVIADWVLEHLPHPLESFAECRRVLKPGGLFAARTPNSRHYTSIISRALGSRGVGRILLRIAQPERRGDDIFTTYYRANTPRKLRSLLRDAGFAQVEILTHEAEPMYLMFNRAALLLGWAYGWLAQRGILPRAALFAFARR